jgi:hypothetical protein
MRRTLPSLCLLACLPLCACSVVHWRSVAPRPMDAPAFDRPVATADPTTAPVIAAPPPPAQWSPALQQVNEQLQQAALKVSAVAVSRTADDALHVCIEAPRSFPAKGMPLSAGVRRFLDTLAGELQAQHTVLVTIAQDGDPPASTQRWAAPRHARWVMHYLIERGVAPGRLSVAMETPAPAAPPLPPRPGTGLRRIAITMVSP